LRLTRSSSQAAAQIRLIFLAAAFIPAVSGGVSCHAFTKSPICAASAGVASPVWEASHVIVSVPTGTLALAGMPIVVASWNAVHAWVLS
jgi:hypothetical protein